MGLELGVHHYTHVCAVALTCTQVLSRLDVWVGVGKCSMAVGVEGVCLGSVSAALAAAAAWMKGSATLPVPSLLT